MNFQTEAILTMFLICKRILLLLKSVLICKMNSLNQENWYF